MLFYILLKLLRIDLYLSTPCLNFIVNTWFDLSLLDLKSLFSNINLIVQGSWNISFQGRKENLKLLEESLEFFVVKKEIQKLFCAYFILEKASNSYLILQFLKTSFHPVCGSEITFYFFWCKKKMGVIFFTFKVV